MMDPNIHNNNNNNEYRWHLENLCREYRIAFESLKELITILPGEKIFSQTELDRYVQDISIIDSNLIQLSSHYGIVSILNPFFA